jgi:hypothetical protein
MDTSGLSHMFPSRPRDACRFGGGNDPRVWEQQIGREPPRRSPGGEVRAAAAPDLDVVAQLQGEDAKRVMLDFVQPAASGGGRSTGVSSHGQTKPEAGFVASWAGTRATPRGISSGRKLARPPPLTPAAFRLRFCARRRSVAPSSPAQ